MHAPLDIAFCAVLSKVVVPPVVSFPENSSPNSLKKVQLVGAVHVTVKVVELVLGAMAPNNAVHRLEPLMVPNWVKVHPDAVSVAFVGVLLPPFAHSMPTTMASLAALAWPVKVSVSPVAFFDCCMKTF